MPKPPLQFTRPGRNREQATNQPDLRPAPPPAIDLDSPEVQAFSLRGRISVPSRVEAGASDQPAAVEPRSQQLPVPASDEDPFLLDQSGIDDPWRHVAVKLPAVSGRKLSEIADLRCSKRTRVALEVLYPPLRNLANAHRVGEYPPLRRVTAGVSRSGVSLILPEDLANDLRFVVETRGAVKAQILARLLVPEIDALFMREVLRRKKT